MTTEKRIGGILRVAAAATLLLYAGSSRPVGEETTASVIVQGEDLATVAALVRGVGGEITHQLGLIDAVAARLTPAQRRELAGVEGVTRLHEDRRTRVAAAVGAAIFRDEFLAVSFAGDAGDANWSGPWQEVGESNGPGSGYARVVSSSKCAAGKCLRIGANLDDDANVGDRGATRQADLSAATTALLSYDYRRKGGSGSVVARVDVSGDGGASWTTLATYPLDSSDAGQTNAVFVLDDFIALGADTRVRFVAAGHYPEESSRYVIELIRIHSLRAEYEQSLDPYMRPKYRELWHAAQTSDEE